mmetsp:Transcript_67588/g.179799  ORF Transcript_67588/g.179799 Transcript_67588/m.179799 type:complete len:203 (+) Transcript_67588:712-1320(+)
MGGVGTTSDGGCAGGGCAGGGCAGGGGGRLRRWRRRSSLRFRRRRLQAVADGGLGLQQRGVARAALLMRRELLPESPLLAERVVDAPADEARLPGREEREVQRARQHVALDLLAVESVAEPRLDVARLERDVAALLPQLVGRALRVHHERVDEGAGRAGLGRRPRTPVALGEHVVRTLEQCSHRATATCQTGHAQGRLVGCR